VSRMVVGMRLRHWRELAGLSAEDVGQMLHTPAAAVIRMEHGAAGVRPRDVAGFCGLYGVADQEERATLLSLARRANNPEWWHSYRDVIPGWFERYLSLEQAASVIRTFETQVIPELLQTPGYARTLLTFIHGNVGDIERRLELQMRRQDMLQSPQPPLLWVILDEAVLRRPTGGRTTMRAQLRHLLSMCDLAGITIDVLPFSLGPHPGIRGPVTVLRLPDRQLPDVVYLEQLTSARYCDAPAECDYYWHVLNLLAIQARKAGPPQDILSHVLRET
jgi:transcriptional regulator with XRE-family HTH domain